MNVHMATNENESVKVEEEFPSNVCPYGGVADYQRVDIAGVDVIL